MKSREQHFYSRTWTPTSWREFEESIQSIRDLHQPQQLSLVGTRQLVTEHVDIVFRGHGSIEWHLETTLERSVPGPMSVARYLLRVDSIRNELESTMGSNWNLPALLDDVLAENEPIGHELGRWESAISRYYPFLVYLRHHGFPSPLLDWSRSPYIAAYFALEQMGGHEEGALIALVHNPESPIVRGLNGPNLKLWGPYTNTHRRHFSQQAQYTTAIRKDQETDSYVFCTHEYIAEHHSDQCRLYCIRISPELRIEFLRRLAEYNINGYTLYQSEDSFVRWMGIRSLLLEQ